MSSFAPYSSIPYSALKFGEGAGTPFKQTDWPNPVRRRQGAVTQLTWTDRFRLAPLGVMPIRQADWPVPRGPVHPISLRTWTMMPQAIMAAPLPVPNIIPNDFPNPRGPAFPTDLRTWVQALTPSAMVFVPPLPKNQEDWPNPTRARRGAPSDWIRGSTWLLSQAAPTIPSARPRDWPVPKGPRRSVSLLTHINQMFYGAPPPPPAGPRNMLSNASGRVRFLKNDQARLRLLAKDPDSG